MNATLPPMVMGLLMLSLGLATGPVNAQAQDVEPLYELVDPVGDVHARLITGQTVPLPSQTAPAVQSMDLTAFRVIDETEQHIILEFEYVDLKYLLSNLEGSNTYITWVRFQIDDRPLYYHIHVYYYEAGALNTANPRPEVSPTPAAFCVRTTPNPPTSAISSQAACQRFPIQARVDYANSVVQVRFPKANLLGISGSGGTDAGFPPTLPVGTRLTGIEGAVFRIGISPFFSITFGSGIMVDEFPNDGDAPPYALARPTAGSAVQLRTMTTGGGFPFLATGDPFMEPLWHNVALPAQGDTAFPVVIRNHADGKRLVNLTLQWPDGAPPPGMTARIAPTVEVPGGDRRTVNLVVENDRALEHRQSAHLVLRAQALGRPDEMDVLWLRLVGSQPPSPDRPVLHFHHVVQRDGFTPVGPFFVCTDIFTCSTRGAMWLNTLETDPLANDAAHASANIPVFTPLGVFPVYHGVFSLDVPLAEPLRFDTERPIDLRVAFSALAEFDAEVVLRLVGSAPDPGCAQGHCAEVYHLGDARKPLRIGTNPTPLDVSLTIPPDLEDVVTVGGSLSLEIQVLNAPVDAEATAGALEVSLHTDRSRLELPLVPDPDRQTAGPRSVGLTAPQGTEEFLNPGRSRTFQVVAVHEGSETETIRIHAEPDAPDWSVRLVPGDHYRLASGESVNLAVVVTAPADAAEGAVGRIHVQARDAAGEPLSATLTLRAIATRGMDIADESSGHTVDQDTQDRWVAGEPHAKSPAVALLPLLLATLALLAGLRRRAAGPPSSRGGAP